MPLAIFVNRHAESFNAHTQRTALVEAYQDRLLVYPEHMNPRKLFDTAMGRIQRSRSLLARHQWSSSLVIDQNVHLAFQTSYELLYQALLSEFDPDKREGIFSGDRVTGKGTKHYSNVATCIRALLPHSSLRIPALDHSLLSLLALYYGCLHAESGLVEVAHACYTRTLGQYSRVLDQFLQKDSAISTRVYQVFTCISIALQMFEILREPGRQNEEYQPHVHGALNALQSGGPQILRTSLDMRKAFCGLRGMAVFVAMERREPTFLAEPDWLNVPFEDIERTTRDRLNDLGLQIPAILKDFDDFTAGFLSPPVSEDTETGMNLLVRVLHLQQSLEEWLDALKVATPEPLYWSRTLPITHAKNNLDAECAPKHSTEGYQLRFLSGPVAGLLVHYWSFCLQLGMASIELHRSLLGSSGQATDKLIDRETLTGGLKRAVVLADGTAQLILEGELYISSCFEGLVCLHWPLRIVSKYFSSRQG